jgi:hypothetical protein
MHGQKTWKQLKYIRISQYYRLFGGLCVTYRRVLEYIIKFIDNLYVQLVTTNNTALSLIYTLYKSLGHAKSSQSSLIVSWQRISTQSLSVPHKKSPFHHSVPFLPFLIDLLRLPSLSFLVRVKVRLRVRIIYDWRFTDNQFVLVPSPLRPTTSIFSTESFRLQSLCYILSSERLSLSFTIATGPRKSSNSRVRVPRDSWPYFTCILSDSRLPQAGGPGPRIYFTQEQAGPVILPGTGFPFHRLLWPAGLGWRYSSSSTCVRSALYSLGMDP